MRTVICWSLRVGGFSGDRKHVPEKRFQPNQERVRRWQMSRFKAINSFTISPLGGWIHKRHITNYRSGMITNNE